MPQDVVEQLLALVTQIGLAERRSELLNGQIVNHTEQQAAVHAALRLAYTSGTPSASSAMAQICADLETMLAMGEFIRSDATVHDVVMEGDVPVIRTLPNASSFAKWPSPPTKTSPVGNAQIA